MTLSDTEDSHYICGTPRHVPLRFSTDSFYRISAMCICKKCGKQFAQIMRYDRYDKFSGSEVKRIDPSDETVAISIMLACHKNHDVKCEVFHMDRPATILQSTQGRFH